jgi:hypothetical protein
MGLPKTTPDQLPRGNFTLYARCLCYDARGDLYRRHRQIIRKGSDANDEMLERGLREAIRDGDRRSIVIRLGGVLCWPPVRADRPGRARA